MFGREGDKRKICNHRQRLERFKQCMKRKNETDIVALVKEEQMTVNEWNAKEEKNQQDFLWALGPEATHQKKHHPNTEPNRTILHKTYYSKYSTDIIYRKETNTTHEETFFGQNKQIGKHREITRRNYSNWRKCDFPDFSTELLISKFVTPIAQRKLRDKLLKEKDQK